MANNQNLDFNKLLPSSLQNELSSGLMSNLFNRFVSNEKSIAINGRIGRQVEGDAVAESTNLDRKLNALVPAIVTKTATEERVATFSDLVDKMQVLGVDVDQMRSWAQETPYNLALPIDLDKFTNYVNYFWVGHQAPAPVTPVVWNSDLQPEYYVIARPAATDLDKMPVRLATTANIELWGGGRPPETFTLTFTSNSTFTVTSNLGSVTSSVTTFNSTPDTATPVTMHAGSLSLCSFVISAGQTPFSAGDVFTIQIKYFTSQIYISLSTPITSGKGSLSGVTTNLQLVTIDGVQVSGGERILVQAQSNSAENGIYIVNSGERWSRAPDANTAPSLSVGSRIWVEQGTANSGKMFSITQQGNGVDPFVLDDTTYGSIDIAAAPTFTSKNINEWQEFNYWVHRDDFVLLSAQYNLDTAVQASRPIIEYSNSVQLNTAWDAQGYPSSPTTIGAVSYSQSKTIFNQIPQFDLFRYDGTHAKITSGIFFYVEDPDFSIDAVLARRIKTTADSDPIFGIGLCDETGRHLFFKNNGQLQSNWTRGSSVPVVTSLQFTGNPLSGTISSLSPKTTADIQHWTITALSANTFSVSGTRSGSVGTATVGTQFNCDDFELQITAGSVAFSEGDTFTFSVEAPLAPRYVRQLQDGSVVNFAGGPIADAADAAAEGTWLTPERMFQNIERENRLEINYGDILNHFRSIIRHQDGFAGVSFGNNNYRTLDKNLGFGGSIREFSSNFPLLLSMLVQRDSSPLSIIDFAEQQYNVALSSIDQFILTELAKHISAGHPITTVSIDPASSDIVQLLEAFENWRQLDFNLTQVFKDTTSGVTNWPQTLPQIGIIAAVQPHVALDPELGIYAITHHDGHISPLSERNAEFDRQLVKTIVERSDGTRSAGIFSESAPTAPYSGQLWCRPSTFELKIFDVISDATIAPASGSAGDYWYNRSAGTLYSWDTVAANWVVSSNTIISRWQPVDIAAIRNSLVLCVENKLFAAVHPASSLVTDLGSASISPLLEAELASFAAKYNYDTYAPDWVATDAFTWNYSSAVISDLSPTPARWFDVYKAHFDKPGQCLPTCRPNLEPWKLLGIATEPSNWAALYASTDPARLWKDQMWVDIKAARPTLKLCVNTATDELLPPYVSATLPQSAEALTTTIPTSAADVYTFGDNGPVEAVWKKSLEYAYGLSRTAWRISPLQFLDQTWGDTYLSVGQNLRLERNTQRSLDHTSFLLHGDRLHNVLSLDAAEVTARLRVLPGGSITVTQDAAVTFEVTHCANNLTVFYVWVNGTLIGMVSEGVAFDLPPSAGIDFTNVIIDDLGIPYELGDRLDFAFSAVSGLSSAVYTPATSKKFKGMCQWFTNFLRFNYIDTSSSPSIDAYRAWTPKLVHRIGTLIKNDSLVIDTVQGTLPSTAFDIVLKKTEQTDSKWITGLRIQLVNIGTRRLNQQGIWVPSQDASDWKFRVETYNPRYSVIRHRVLDTAGPSHTFKALNGVSCDLAWRRYINSTAVSATALPLTITGLQETINFIYGYVDQLEADGWDIGSGNDPVTDAETGRNIDWQLEVEKLIDRVWTGMSAGEGHIVNPFMDKLFLKTPIGLLSQFSSRSFIDSYSTQAAFDTTGAVIPVSKLAVIRTDDGAVIRSQLPIFSAHVFIDEFEHCIVLNKNFSDETGSAKIFDPFLGARIDTAMLSYVRQDATNRKPTFDGFFLNGNTVSRNIVSSIDNIASYYDSNNNGSDADINRHAMSLLGYSPKNYFDHVTSNKSSRFNFWRGLIQAKGTNMTVDAFVNYKKFNSAEVDEFWAYKIAEYGDAREKTFPEIKINVADVTQRFARFQFLSATSTDQLSMFSPIDPNDSSRWFSLDDLGNGLKFEASQISEIVTVETDVGTEPLIIKLKNIYHTGDLMGPTVASVGSSIGTAEVIGSSLIKITSAAAGAQFRVSGYTWINPTKLSPIKLYDYTESALVEDIPLWHPAIGIHTPLALEIVNITDSRDPALYSYSTQTVNNPNLRYLKPWGAREVGRVWWDTHNLAYLPYHDSAVFPNRDARESRWGAMAEWASIDLYEWTESPVPPTEYNALAAAQEGDSSIDVTQRASGRVGLRKYYSRQRTISTRPIAWSHTGNGGAAHPAFGPALFTNVWSTGDTLIADRGRLADLDIQSPRHFGAWLNNKPVGEVEIGTSISYVIGSSLDIAAPQLVSAETSISALRIGALNNGALGSAIGQISINKKETAPGVFSIRLSTIDGNYEDVAVSDWYSTDATVDYTKNIVFEKFGLVVTLERSASAPVTISAQVLANSISSPSNDLYIRESVNYTEIISLPDALYVNDPQDPMYSRTEYEWRSWSVPTQGDLSSDLAAPNNEWQPYLGAEIAQRITADIVKQMSQSSSTLTLKSGIEIKRFSTTWTPWHVLQDIVIEQVAIKNTPITFAVVSETDLDLNRLSIYANGIQLNPGGYTILGNSVELVNTLAEGTTITLLYRAYMPNASELAFDPATNDDLTIQTQYKLDYEYSSIDVRDEYGNITGKRYYFWVQDKSIPQQNKKMSLIQAKNILKSGPSSFAIFSRLLPDADGASYDSCSISGLGLHVTKNAAYKLRFLRNFTLRDDPEEIKLKNTHAEWTLLRRTQNVKIPAALWEHITAAVAGTDIGGAAVPSQVRVDYDLRNGTRTRFGFSHGQIFADTGLVRTTIVNSILNTSLTIKIGSKVYPDYITALNLDEADKWFATPQSARDTMALIWNTARSQQINEIFFNVLDDALANNYEFSDLFKTSFITVSSDSPVVPAQQQEQLDGIF